MLECGGNQFSELDVSKLTKLKEFYCKNSKVKNLDLTKCALLEQIGCESGEIQTLNVKGLANLKSLTCSNNQITELDLSTNAKLFENTDFTREYFLSNYNGQERKGAEVVKEGNLYKFDIKPYVSDLSRLGNAELYNSAGNEVPHSGFSSEGIISTYWKPVSIKYGYFFRGKAQQMYSGSQVIVMTISGLRVVSGTTTTTPSVPDTPSTQSEDVPPSPQTNQEVPETPSAQSPDTSSTQQPVTPETPASSDNTPSDSGGSSSGGSGGGCSSGIASFMLSAVLAFKFRRH
ncbi:MAG: hypothetical protein IJS28_10910 [Synergistaceae bacterium]|nr:hypothetical protein [Synergistaceae bacterium]